MRSRHSGGFIRRLGWAVLATLAVAAASAQGPAGGGAPSAQDRQTALGAMEKGLTVQN